MENSHAQHLRYKELRKNKSVLRGPSKYNNSNVIFASEGKKNTFFYNSFIFEFL